MNRNLMNKIRKIAFLSYFSVTFSVALCACSNQEAGEDVTDIPQPQSEISEGTDSLSQSKTSESADDSSVSFQVNWQGEIFESDASPAGVEENLDTLVWMALREGESVAEDVAADEDKYIPESDKALGDSGEAEDNVWVRVVQKEFVPEEGTFGQIAHKDYLFYRQGEDAYVGIQSAENNDLWTILKMADYGEWLEKEIRIYVRMTTGL